MDVSMFSQVDVDDLTEILDGDRELAEQIFESIRRQPPPLPLSTPNNLACRCLGSPKPSNRQHPLSFAVPDRMPTQVPPPNESRKASGRPDSKAARKSGAEVLPLPKKVARTRRCSR